MYKASYSKPDKRRSSERDSKQKWVNRKSNKHSKDINEMRYAVNESDDDDDDD